MIGNDLRIISPEITLTSKGSPLSVAAPKDPCDAEIRYVAGQGNKVLARVPKGKIVQRAAYEFFGGLDAQGQPLWSSAIADRGAVFEHRGRCYRSGITDGHPRS